MYISTYIYVHAQTICILSRCLDIYIHILNSTPPWWGILPRVINYKFDSLQPVEILAEPKRPY